MRSRIPGNRAVLVAALLVAIGLGIGVAPAASRQASSIWAATVADASASPSASTTATLSASSTTSATPSTSTSSDGSECANVYLVTAPAGTSVGKLCTAVTHSGTTISSVAVTYTASSSCSGDVTLHVSGADAKQAEFAVVKTVTCSSKTATASFTPVSSVASNTYICGMLMADKYTAAQACVAIS